MSWHDNCTKMHGNAQYYLFDLTWFIQHRQCIGPHVDAKSVCLELMLQPLPRLTPFFECPCSFGGSKLWSYCLRFVAQSTPCYIKIVTESLQFATPLSHLRYLATFQDICNSHKSAKLKSRSLISFFLGGEDTQILNWNTLVWFTP